MKIIAGPCVIESMDLLREVAAELARIKKELDVEIYFKASFDKQFQHIFLVFMSSY